MPGSAAVVIASIASTSFDGAQDGASRARSKAPSNGWSALAWDLTGALRLTDTIFIRVASPGSPGVYLIGVRGMRSLGGAPFRKLPRASPTR